MSGWGSCACPRSLKNQPHHSRRGEGGWEEQGGPLWSPVACSSNPLSPSNTSRNASWTQGITPASSQFPTIQSKDPVLLKVEGITFGYEREPLLYNVHLQVHRGEIVGLLGPNGSGKTTLLRLISGVLHPQKGKILLEGRELQQWGRRRIAQRIAVVPQEISMPFAYTVQEMVSLGRIPFSSWFKSENKQDFSIVFDAMRAAEVSTLARRIFNELSGGERQRVLLAMALAQQPQLLLLDEPTSHLDMKYQIDILELLQRLNRDMGVTVIAAMHDLNLAARYFPRLILFQRGVVADAGPAEILEPGLLRRVYGINVQVGILRGAEYLSVLPPGSQTIEDKHQGSDQPQVHLMAGGGSGELMMRALADAHISFVAGALNVGDSDHTLALRLANEVITEQPYAPLSNETLANVRASLANLKLLILCPMPIGPGNLALLEEALLAARRGLPVLLLASALANMSVNEERQASAIPAHSSTGPEDQLLQLLAMHARDYTGGQGSKLMRELLQAGATVVGSVGEATEAIKKYVILADTQE